MVAELFFAVFAGETSVGLLRKAFRVSMHSDLPSCQQSKGKPQQAPRIDIWYKNKGSKHHCKIPIVDTAGRAASVLHKPRLEGTEKEDADHITDTVCETDKDKDALIDEPKIIKRSDSTVKGKPRKSDGKCPFPRLQFRLALPGRYIIFSELLLASGAFKP